jgi:glycosyltransferase involved in cell wall biosynthesis
VSRAVRVALVHDWLTGMRGGEKVLEALCELYPDADLFTLLHVPGKLSPTIENRTIRTSFVQRLPRARTAYRNYLPLFPTAIEQFDLRGYDLVLSSSHCVAKGVITQPATCHFSYIHTPMRYVWELYHDYFGEDKIGWLRRQVVPVVTNYLRMWDVASAGRVDEYIANSHHVARRILKHYHREATVINPPVDTDLFALSERRDDFFLIVSALAPYKRIELAIETFNALRLPLKIVGIGEQAERLRALAGPTVEMLGWQPDEAVRDLYQRCRAFVFPQEEDFGITPLEAQACGKPVIAFGKGGALETVVGVYAEDGTPGRFLPVSWQEAADTQIDLPMPEAHDLTGVFFRTQTVEALSAAIRHFASIEDRFRPAHIRRHALGFGRRHFQERVREHIETRYAQFRDALGLP